MADAKSTFRSMESAIRSAFVGIGVNGIQGSIMRTVPIDERIQLLFNLTHAGIDTRYKFHFEEEILAKHDWMNIIAPVSICFENEKFTMNNHIGKVYFIEEYPKSLESDIVAALTKVNCTSYITINNELLDIAGFKQEIARKYMGVGMKIENEKQRNRNNNDFLADASTKPVIMYNVPSRTGCNLLPDTVAKLADHPNIVAVKEASGNMAQVVEIAAKCGDKMGIYSGEDGINVPIMSMGGLGCISVLSNVAPKLAVEMTDKFFAGDLAGAAELQCRTLALINALFSEVNPIPAKAGVTALGFGEEHLRMPLTPMEDATRANLYAQMRKLGLLK